MKVFNYMICKKYFFLIPIVVFLLFSCNTTDKNSTGSSAGSIDKAPVKIQTVEVVKPAKRKFEGEVVIAGTAKPNQQVELHALENGYVSRLLKDIGDPVREGEVVAILENPELGRQQQRTKAIFEGKKSIYDRLNSVYEKTPALTTAQSVEQAKAEYLSAKAEYDAISDRISFLQVKAPFSGIITKRYIDKGALVQSGISSSGAKPIYQVQQINPIRLSLPLPASDVSGITNSMDVNVSFPELQGESFKAKVSRTSTALDPVSKTMELEIDIPNPKGIIRPGMYAKASLKAKSREEVLSLPVEALVIDRDGYNVLLANDQLVVMVPVRKGLSNKEWFEVLNPDINENSLVIVQGKGLVKPGQSVEPILKREQ